MSQFRDVAAAVETQLNDDSVKFQYGRDELAKHEQKRRIVWVRKLGVFEAPKNQGGKSVNGSGGVEQRIRIAFMKVEEVEAHIYAENEDSCEVLFDAVLAAIKRVGVWILQPVRYEWQTELDGISASRQRQPKIMLVLQSRILVADEESTLVVITDIQHSCKLNGEQG